MQRERSDVLVHRGAHARGVASDTVHMTATSSPPDIGEVAPDFELRDANGTNFHLADACAKQPLVVVFYRGHW